ncbi:T9SS type A sorting domain-containing protein [Ilyomonas limi]|uniref:T9SS type A sorting domain-containing protein n=1 Tax=Ilyomonas limi TaxID=2575867 RepID=A0A4U3L364_9BACT|nr:ELWxxDGT repeat protein [Ilyomonas limi]TKK69322.1 T9SS type A sorting domain-containing protein [Ilyomonas limi]
MKNLPFFIKFFTLSLCLLPGALAQAQNIRAIDIEKSTDAAPRNNMYTTLDMYAELNGIFYFNADDGIHGRELWRSDGTAAGTWLLKDINNGVASSNPDDIIVSGNKFYFAASDGLNGRELWVSDGTAIGTYMVLDIGIFNQDANPSYLTDVNGTLYFVTDAYTYNGRDKLWKTDGTAAGTIMIADFSSFYPVYGGNTRYLTNVNGKLFFTMESFFSDPQLYTADGTEAGVFLVKDINPFGQDLPANLTPLNGLLYFAAEDGTGVHLWVSDGTDAGTHAVNNSDDISLPSFYYDNNERPFAISGKTLFFQGSTFDSGVELCRYNSSNQANNVQLVKDMVPGSGSSFPDGIMNVNGTVFFTITADGVNETLWKSNGAAAGTVQVKGISPGGTNLYYGLVNKNGILMFVYANASLGFELWKSDGTDAGTVLVKDIMSGLYSSYPQFLTYKHNTFLFGANDGVKGLELWKSDGTSAGTAMIKDINYSSSASSYPFGFTASATNKNKALLAASTYKYGYELWESNGYAAGTSLVKDIYPGSGASFPSHLTNFKNKTYFFANNNKGYYLGKTDGTAAGTSLFYQLNITGYVQDMAATNNLLYFTVFNYSTYLQELWRSDGTAAGTGIIKNDILPYYSLTPVGVGNMLFFVNTDFEHGTELWKSDGTTAGTVIVKDIRAGYDGSYPFNLHNFDDKLYFAADYGYGPFLYTSDGTDAGTKVLKAVLIQPYTPFAQAHNKLFFDAYSTVASGYELYATDGTSAGTKLVRDINNGPASSNPFALVNGDTLLYFMADDGKHGAELWVSNGVKTGTHLIKNITPGIDNSYFSYMVNVNDKLFFTMNDTLWQSDATNGGTHKMQDPTLDGMNSIYGLTRVGDWLYFSGYKQSTGQEVYTARVADFFITSNTITQQKMAAPATGNDVFAVKLLTNPFSNQLRFSISVKEQQAAQVTITDATGRVIQTVNKNLQAGTTILSYDAGNWAHGMYMVKVILANSLSATLKAVK